MKYYVKHYDDNNQLFQTINVKNDQDLQTYKEVQISQGEYLLVYFIESDELMESYSCD